MVDYYENYPSSQECETAVIKIIGANSDGGFSVMPMEVNQED